MPNLKKRNEILTQSEGRFKPMIAASLALALGVGVVSAASYGPYTSTPGNDKYGIFNSKVNNGSDQLTQYSSTDGDVFTAIDAINSSDATKSGNAYGIKQYNSVLTLDNNATFNSIKGVDARGINTTGTKGAVVLGGASKTITFTEIVGTRSAYGIDNASSATDAVKLSEGNLTFSKIVGTTSSIGFQNTGSGTGLKVGDSKAAVLTFTKIGGTDASSSSGSAYGMLLNGTSNSIVVNGQDAGHKAKILFSDVSATKNAVGIMHKQGNVDLNVGQFGDITFSKIDSTGANAIGIQTGVDNGTITLGASSNAGTITFSKIETSAGASGSSMGIYATKNTTLNINGAVVFSSITSATSDVMGAYSTKDADSAQGELKIDIKTNGSLTFNDISSTSATTSGDAYGLKASNKLHIVNANNASLIFASISSESNFAYGLRSREIVINNTGKEITFASIEAKGTTIPGATNTTPRSVVGIMLDGGKTALDGGEVTNLNLSGNLTFTSLSAPSKEYVIYAKQSTTNPDVPLKIATTSVSTITATGTNNLVGIATTGTTKIDTANGALTLNLQGKNGGTTSATGLLAMGGSFELTGDKLNLKVGNDQNTQAYGVKLEGGYISGNLTFNGTDSYVKVKGAEGNTAYGIHTSESSTIKSGTITFANNALNAGNDGTAYVLFNDGNLTLGSSGTDATTASIVAGSAKPADHTVGISDSIAGSYVFGTTRTSGTTTTIGSTVLNVAGVAGKSGVVDGKNATGLYFEGVGSNATANLAGNLVANIVGGSGFGDGSIAGGNGGDAYGLYLKSTQANSNANLALKNSIITLNAKGGTAGNGATRAAVSQGNAGSAYGIFVDAATNQSVKISGDNNSQIVLNVAAGDAGTVGATGTAGSSYAIKNGITTSSMTLTFENVGIVTGTQAATRENPFALYNGAASNYDFGTVGTVFSVTGATGAAGETVNPGQSGNPVEGIIIANDLKHTGVMTLNVAGGNGGNAASTGGSEEGLNGGRGADALGVVFEGGNYIVEGATSSLALTATAGNGGNGHGEGTNGNGGNAYAIVAQSGVSTLTTGASGSTLTLSAVGGAAGSGGNVAGSGGEAVGVLVQTAEGAATKSKLSLSGEGTLAFTVGDSINTSVAYGLKLEDGVFAGSLSFGSQKIQATNRAYAIYTSGTSAIESGTIALTASNSLHTAINKYVLFNEGNLTLGSAAVVGDDKGVTAQPAKNVSIVAGDASHVADKGIYGIFSNIDSANYAFGTTTAYITGSDGAVGTGDLTSGGQNGGNGTIATGLILEDSAVVSGNLTQTIVAGSGGAGSTNANPTNGGNGGNVYGIAMQGGKTLTLQDGAILSFDLKAGAKGAAGQTPVRAAGRAATAGADGAAFGIYRDAEATNKTDAMTFLGKGKIQFTAVTNGDASAGYILKNAAANTEATTNTITFGADDFTNSQVTLAAGNISGMAEGVTYGIYSNVPSATGAKYDFGSLQSAPGGTAGDSAGTLFYVSGDAGVAATAARTGVAATNGGDVVGVYVGGSATFEGKLSLQAKGGVGGDVSSAADANVSGKNGGNSKAIYAADGAILNLTDNSITTLKAIGGDGSKLKGTQSETVVDGAQGDAYGIYTSGAFTLNTNALGKLSLSVEGNNAYGIYLAGVAKTVGGVQSANVVNIDRLTLVGSDANNGAINGVEAYGIYNATNADNKLSGTITLGDGTNAAIGSDSTTKAYGIYNVGNLEIAGSVVVTDNALKTSSVSGSKAYILYNKGTLTLGKDGAIKVKDGVANSLISSNLGASSTLVLGNLNASNVNSSVASAYVFSADATNTVLDLKVTDTALNNSNSGYVLNLAGKTTVFSQTNSAKIDLDLGSFDTAVGAQVNNTVGTKVVFGSDAGAINTLKGDHASILLAGADQQAVNVRFASKAFSERTLTIADMQLDGSTFVLAAKTAESKADKIAVTNSQASGQVSNDIAIVLDGYSTSSTPVTLATVATPVQDKVIFNGLKENDKTTNSVVYSGFTTAEVKIKREVDGVNGVKYTSTLEATNIQVNTDFVAPTTAALSAGVSLFSANLNSLSKRMGELRNDPYANGVWARVFAGEQTTDFGAKQSTVYSTFQAGYDYKLALEDASNYIGLAVSYTKGAGGQVDPVAKYAPTPLNTLVAGLSSSNTNGVEVALYNSYVSNSGLYSDSIVKVGYYMNDLTMFMQPDTYSTSNLALAVSEEIGYKVKLGESNEWFITPQGEIAFAYMGGTEFTQHDGIGGFDLKSTQDATSLLRARVGAAWGYDFSHLAKESDIKASLYVGTYYMYDYFIGGDTTLSTTAGGQTVDYKHNAYEGTGRFVMNLGTNIDVKDSTKVYVDFEKSFGGKIQTDYQISLGVRFGFGEKVSAPKPEEKKSSEPVLKPKELDASLDEETGE